MEWWDKSSDLTFTKKFISVLDFYLINCPVEKRIRKKDKTTVIERVSHKGKTLRERKWVSHNLNSLLYAMKNVCSNNYLYRPLDKDSSFDVIEQQVANGEDYFEMILIKNRSDMCITQSILYSIRNALAHGTFSKVGSWYYFESKKGKSLNGRIRLKEETLLKWIELINSKPGTLSKNHKKQEKKK